MKRFIVNLKYSKLFFEIVTFWLVLWQYVIFRLSWAEVGQQVSQGQDVLHGVAVLACGLLDVEKLVLWYYGDLLEDILEIVLLFEDVHTLDAKDLAK